MPYDLRASTKKFCFSLTAALIFGQAAYAEPWSIKEFDVVNFRLLNADQLKGVNFDGGPGTRQWYNDYIDTALAGLPFDLERFGETMAPMFDEAVMENHLKIVAGSLEAWDLPAPKLNPIVAKDFAGDAYRIYIVQNLKEGLALYHPVDCRKDSNLNVILVSSGDVFSGGQITDNGLKVLTHELVHSVEWSTSLYRSACTKAPTDWITEGMADAIAFDLALGESSPTGVQDVPRKRISGARDYSAPLHKPRTNLEAYESSSFWRFLAEYYAHRFFGKPQPGPAFGPVHYGYVDSLFDRSSALLADDSSERPVSEVKLLDDWIKSTYSGESLRSLYTLFVAALPYYPALRTNEWNRGPGGNIAFSEDDWLKSTFGTCPVVELSPENPVTEPSLFSIEEIAASCWRIDVSGFHVGSANEKVPVLAEVFGDEAELTQLAAGAGVRADTVSQLIAGAQGESAPPPPVRVETEVLVQPSGSPEGDFETSWTFPYQPLV